MIIIIVTITIKYSQTESYRKIEFKHILWIYQRYSSKNMKKLKKMPMTLIEELGWDLLEIRSERLLSKC